MTRLSVLAWLVFALLTPASLFAQEDRYEVGQRLRALEKAIDAQPDPAARKRAIEPLKQATFTFLTGQVKEAGRQLDRARLALASDKEPAVEVAWAESLTVLPGSRLLDAVAGELPCKLALFYEVKTSKPDKAKLRLTLCQPGGKPVAPAVMLDVDAIPFEAKLPFKNAIEGDYLLVSEVVIGDKTLARSEQTVSLVAKLEERLEKLRTSVKTLDEKPRHTDKETVRKLAGLLTDLQQKKTLEANFPAARLLAEAETAMQMITAGKGYYGQGKTGQFWLTLATEKGTPSVRLQAPDAAKKGKPLPLVIALHGAGGSENMFFDCYGNGAIARLCEERGWLLVATRNGLAPGVIEEVNRLYPVDMKRIFLVGHSMGAAQAVAAAGATPERFAGVAALGGGGTVKPSDGIKGVPFFVGVGSEDFALAGAKALNTGLKKAEVEKFVYREYADVEHLLIVQLSLKEVFAFFDEAAKR